MIFVTVGTHEQPFTRLVEYMDKWAASHDEEVVIQVGYSEYEPKHCTWQRFYHQYEMDKFNADGRIVVTHGGPSCYMEVIHLGKIPVVVPRRHEFGEHVDNHQLDISRRYSKLYNSILLVEQMDQLGEYLDNYDDCITDKTRYGLPANNAKFCDEFTKIIDKLLS